MRIIAGNYKGRILKTGSGPGYRPATGKVRESLYSILESAGINWQGIHVLDVFAGTGSLGFEALSRGCQHVTFVEKSASACRILRENVHMLDACKQCRIVQRDAFSFFSCDVDMVFDLVFVDPPYGKGYALPVLQEVLRGGWLRTPGILCAETEADVDLTIFADGDLQLFRDRSFGQTRIYIWQKR